MRKLGHTWLAREAWLRLVHLNKPTAIAHQLWKYWKEVAAETEIIKAQNNEIIARIAGGDGGQRPSIKTGTPKHEEYAAEFDAYLNGSSDLNAAPFDLDALMAALNRFPENKISESDIGLLEPFFNQKGPEEETG